MNIWRTSAAIWLILISGCSHQPCPNPVVIDLPGHVDARPQYLRDYLALIGAVTAE